MAKVYDFRPEYKGMRLTDCCGAFSTFCMDSGELSCKVCWNEVGHGQGDGEEFINTVNPLDNATIKWEVTI